MADSASPAKVYDKRIERVPEEDRHRFKDFLGKDSYKNDDDTTFLMMYIMYAQRADVKVVK